MIERSWNSIQPNSAQTTFNSQTGATTLTFIPPVITPSGNAQSRSTRSAQPSNTASESRTNSANQTPTPNSY